MARSRELRVVIAGDADKLERELKKSGGALDKFGKQTRLTGTLTSKGFAAMRVGAVGATAAVGGLAVVGKRVIDVASDIDESLSKNRVLFGKYATDIDKFSKTSATSLGISRASALEATGTFGNLFTALELGPKASAEMSTSLVTLAADMASFNNASPEETLEAIRSGLVGETEPLRRFGVNLNDATLRAEALRMGLVKTTKESLEPQTRALAVNSLLFKQTGKAQGDFARTSEGAANQQRILNAQFSDAQAKLGDLLLPTFTKGISKVNKFVGEIQSGTGAGGRFADTMTDIWSETKPIVTWIGRATANVARFTAEHPNVGKLASAVVGVGLAVKGLKFVSAATGFSDLLKAGRSVMKRLVAHFAAQGAVAGAAAGSAAAGGEGLTSAASFGKVRNAGGRLGKVGGRALGVGMVAGILLAFPDIYKKIDSFENSIRDKLFGVGKGIAGKLNPFGDGVGVDLPSGGGGDLKGADRDLGPFAAIGRGMGLSVSSGLRRGSITKSGNLSHHASGDAIDMAGPPGKMLAYFRALKSRYGGRLAELIYTPGGAGIKNGRPHTYTGAVAADHFDHVHVAYTGQGGAAAGNRGADVNRRRRARTGDGIGTAVKAARAVGLSGSDLVTMVAIAGAESGYNAKINAAGPEDSRGLWQINVGPGANPDMLKLGNLYDPFVNAKAMKIIRARQGLGAWTVYRTGAYRDYVERARAAVTGSRGGATTARSGGGGSSTVDRSEQAEKAGSRIVNSLTRKYSPGIDRAIRAATRTGELMEERATAYGQLERRFGQSEEDLGTAGGRTRRLSEIAALKAEKAKQLTRAQRRARHLQTAVSRLNKLIRDARKKRDKARGGTRARIVKRIRDFEDRRTDLAAELKSIENETIPDLQLDIGDLDKDAAEVAATEDTGAAEAREEAAEAARPVNFLASRMAIVDAMERAGDLSAEQARAERERHLQLALGGAFGAITDMERLQLRGDLRELQTQALVENTSALRDVQSELAKANAIATSQVGIQLSQATRALGDLVSGELGTRTAQRGSMPGYGRLASVGNGRY